MNKLFKGRKQNEKATSQRQNSLDIFRSLFCLSGEITAYLFRIRSHANLYATNGAPRQFCMRHLDFLARMSQNCGLGRTLLVACVMPYHAWPPVSRDTALHKQHKVKQPSESKHCSGIPYVLISLFAETPSVLCIYFKI